MKAKEHLKKIDITELSLIGALGSTVHVKDTNFKENLKTKGSFVADRQ